MTSAPASKAATKTTTGAYNVRQYYQPRTTTNTRGGGGGGGGGVTTLMYAAQQGNVDVVRKILRIQVCVPLCIINWAIMQCFCALFFCLSTFF